MPVLNDIHSRMNATHLRQIFPPHSESAVQQLILNARHAHTSLCTIGGRHAMGGQQFQTDAWGIDSSGLGNPVQKTELNTQLGLLTIGAGARWPEIIAATRADGESGWAIRQKQTGADDMTIAGSISANAHGRGLSFGPLVDDVESFRIVLASGEALECSRSTNAELFSLAIGGYGLFGVITQVTLRLVPRQKLQRLVDIIDLDDARNAVYRRAEQGCLYGDFQYAIDPSDSSFLRRGVMACYQPVSETTPLTSETTDLPRESWLELLKLAHTDKRKAFQLYSQHYLASHGRVYWSDAMQLSTYIPTYAEFLAESRGTSVNESLMITELFVPPDRLMDFMHAARAILLLSGVEDIYGTIRSIRQDTTTFLPWAKADYACVIFNLRTRHTPESIAQTQHTARALIDAALDLSGSYYLTYHRWATRSQLLRAYPQMPLWLKKKLEYDPTELFQSTWHYHIKSLIHETSST